MKYYLYISDSKLDMLLPQIPHEAKTKIATELKFDLKILGVTRKSESDAQENRYEKLDAVTTFIREYGNLGAVDQPEDFFEGSLEMGWGLLTPDCVYFGTTYENNVVGLGGSATHVIGPNPVPSLKGFNSLMPFLVNSLMVNQRGTERTVSEPQRLRAAMRSANSALIANAPIQRLEFMAKRLHCEHHHGQQLLLGSPLYVAMVD